MKKLIFILLLTLGLIHSAHAEAGDFILRDWVDSPLNDCLLGKAAEVTAQEGNEFMENRPNPSG